MINKNLKLLFCFISIFSLISCNSTPSNKEEEKHSSKNIIKTTDTLTSLEDETPKEDNLEKETPIDEKKEPSKENSSKKSSWPTKVFAPFVDMCAFVEKGPYSIDGTVNLLTISNETSTKFFNLGFIQSQGSSSDLSWGFAGLKELSEGSNHPQYLGIKKSIEDLRKSGGDVSLSFGGLNGTPLWMATSDKSLLKKTYKEIIKTFSLSRIDLDIEGPSQNYEKNLLNAKALGELQKELDFEITLTLPVLPTGLTSEGVNVLKAYLKEGVDIKMINIMAMCYGKNTLKANEDYGDASIRAMSNTRDQIIKIFKEVKNKDISKSEAYSLLGVTPSIGFESEMHPLFTKENSKLIVDFAKKNNLQMVSFWSLNRDATLDKNIGVKNKYEFTEIFNDFLE